MRQIILDTETTGLYAHAGDRIVEIGCVELLNRRLTGNNFHAYINPERDSEPAALAVHGLTTAFLSDKPKFAAIAAELRDYLKDAEVIIHNAPFDVGFLDAELARLGFPCFADHVASIIDTLVQAKAAHPGKRNSLDALCDRYGISNAHRTLHGALLDAELLAEVYLAMTRGQNSLSIDLEVAESSSTSAEGSEAANFFMPDLQVLRATKEEIVEHEGILCELDQEVKGACVWRDANKNSSM